MRTVLIAIVVMLSLSALACSQKAGGQSGPSDLPDSVQVITDKKTGCQYLVLYEKAITPRLNKGGADVYGCRG